MTGSQKKLRSSIFLTELEQLAGKPGGRALISLGFFGS
jgi:hypothetical protein